MKKLILTTILLTSFSLFSSDYCVAIQEPSAYQSLHNADYYLYCDSNKNMGRVEKVNLDSLASKLHIPHLVQSNKSYKKGSVIIYSKDAKKKLCLVTLHLKVQSIFSRITQPRGIEIDCGNETTIVIEGKDSQEKLKNLAEEMNLKPVHQIKGSFRWHYELNYLGIWTSTKVSIYSSSN